MGKGGQCIGLTTLPLLCADFLEILGVSTSWKLKGLYRDSFNFSTTRVESHASIIETLKEEAWKRISGAETFKYMKRHQLRKLLVSSK